MPKCVVEYLSEWHEVFDGRLGARIDVSKASGYSQFITPKTKYPRNDQEYDVFIVDLQKSEPIPYIEEEHVHPYVEDGENPFFYCQRPQTLYDLMPYGAYLLKRTIKTHKGNTPIIIVFQEEKYTRRYKFVNKISETRYQDMGEEESSNYGFAETFPFEEAHWGTQVEVCEDDELAKILFHGLESKLSYRQTFYQPKKYNIETGAYEDSPDVRPMLHNGNGRIISFVQLRNGEPLYIVLPQADDETKLEIIKRLFDDVLYDTCPEYFPMIAESRWIHKEDYALKGVKEIEAEEECLELSYKRKKQELADKKEEVQEKYGFLHTMLTATGDELVQAVIKYLRWLGFEHVIDKDTTKDKLFEEDIQIKFDDRDILIIEVKGLYGTSKDAECSQIDKIKKRRLDEDKDRRVYSLYIVNHQRGKEPLERVKQPFMKEQVFDAVENERGLLTTWQLFAVFDAVELGVISREEVRRGLLQSGLVSFEPDLVEPLPEVCGMWHEGKVIGLKMEKPISVGDRIFTESNGRWICADVVSLKKEDKLCEMVTCGEVGVGLSQRMPKGQLYLKRMNETRH